MHVKERKPMERILTITPKRPMDHGPRVIDEGDVSRRRRKRQTGRR
jgi:hypothetical protein